MVSKPAPPRLLLKSPQVGENVKQKVEINENTRVVENVGSLETVSAA